LTVVTVYVPEEFTPAESDILKRYFTNLDSPVFALVNLPEVVKGALFARYSRSAKSLRRLFLDEFVNELEVQGDVSLDATIGIERAESLYEKIFVEYGDDSVAQLGGVHLACEQASNLLTKILEWGRLMSYLEQSTRYISYDNRLGGRYRFYRDPEVLSGRFGTRYVGDMDRMFDTYSGLVESLTTHVRKVVPQGPKDSDFIYRQATRAKALDAVRGVLPASALSNVGIYGSGQAYEALLLRMRANPLPEARLYADLMLTELRKVVPSFLRRVDQPDRGGRWSQYLSDTSIDTHHVVHDLFATEETEPEESVVLSDFDPEGEDKLLAAICYSHLTLSESQIYKKVQGMNHDEKVRLIRAYVGDRTNRRHRPGRAFERTDYRFDVLSDYGAFRDMQRHRMLTIEWQPLTPNHGYVRPDIVDDASQTSAFDEVMDRSADLYDALLPEYPTQAAYAVSMAYRIRYVMQFNAREAMHMLELRSSPQGHPAYRKVALDMHALIRDQAGHKAVAEAMIHMTTEVPELERLESERRQEAKRNA
jgi:thymidylate synthase ThyX